MSGESNIVVRAMTEADFAAVIEIARGLPEWFTSSGIDHLGRDIQFQRGLIAAQADQIVGFVTFFAQDSKGQIGWMAVRVDFHRRRIGAVLLGALETLMLGAGIRELYVNTLGDSVNYEPYARTRAFYRRMGFQDFKRVHSNNSECEELLTMRKLL